MNSILLRFLMPICLFSIVSIGILHAQWVQTGGLTDANIRCLLVSDTTIFAGTDNRGIYRSTENGTEWTAINTGLTATFILALAESSPNLFAGTNNGAFISTDKGDSWAGINDGLTDTYINAIVAIGPTLFAGTNDSGIFVSTNNGINWTATNTGLMNKSVTCLAVCPNGVGGSNIFAGTYGAGVFFSSNNGESWTDVRDGLRSEYIRKLAVCSIGTGGSNIYAGTYHDGVCLSTDNGSDWTAVNTGLTDHAILSLASSGLNIFAGTDGGGVCLSTDNGTNWTAVGTDLTNQNIYSVAASNSYIFAGTFNIGVWKRPLSEIIIPTSVSTGNFIKEFRLEQNYPNPFNPSTKFEFRNPNFEFVSLKIYDILGREVATLINGIQSAGKHTVEWNAEGFPSGIYFYRLQAGIYTETKKLMLLK